MEAPANSYKDDKAVNDCLKVADLVLLMIASFHICSVACGISARWLHVIHAHDQFCLSPPSNHRIHVKLSPACYITDCALWFAAVR